MYTGSPICTLSESAITATRAVGGTRSIWMSERSAAGSEAMTLALTVSPPRNSTSISFIEWTTWAAVMILPSGEIRTPEPVSLNFTTPPAVTSLPLARITTTLGVTLRNTSPGVWASTAMGTERRIGITSGSTLAIRISSPFSGRVDREGHTLPRAAIEPRFRERWSYTLPPGTTGAIIAPSRVGTDSNGGPPGRDGEEADLRDQACRPLAVDRCLDPFRARPRAGAGAVGRQRVRQERPESPGGPDKLPVPAQLQLRRRPRSRHAVCLRYPAGRAHSSPC